MYFVLQELLAGFGLNAGLVLWAMWLLSSYISGSAVLAVMHGNCFTPNDLDFYFLLAHRDLYLVEDLGSIGKKIYTARYPLPGIDAIWYFRNRKTNAIINVIVTKTHSPLPAIIGFHSTLVMNFISYFGIVSLYHEGTAKKQGWYNGTGRMKRRDERWADKYRSRGFHIFKNSQDGQDAIGWHNVVHRLAALKQFGHCSTTVFMRAAELLETLEPWFVGAWRQGLVLCAMTQTASMALPLRLGTTSSFSCVVDGLGKLGSGIYVWISNFYICTIWTFKFVK
ncbi:hypothetical protein BKA70DRAFT_1223412 [Coprinopsis sp. MPI-PUGE-AT-0042]|nr:hypothetical protein BKA70DRAFT_1223412 [Coprinopsis sp. MPI-PUGE-AT-0042]